MIVVPQTDEQNAALCMWAAKKIRQEPFRNARAIGILDKHHDIKAVVVLHDWSHPNIFLSWAGEGNWMKREVIFHVYQWAYVQIGAERITGLVDKANKKARKLNEHLGMKLEGVLRKASPTGRDLFVYGLLRKEAEALVERLTRKRHASTNS